MKGRSWTDQEGVMVGQRDTGLGGRVVERRREGQEWRGCQDRTVKVEW